MKVLPRRILKMTTVSTEPNNTFGFVIEATDTKKSITLLGTKLNESVDETILNDLVDKYAYASALLYFVENFKDSIVLIQLKAATNTIYREFIKNNKSANDLEKESK